MESPTDALIYGIHAQVLVELSTCILLFSIVLGELVHVLHTLL